MIKLNIHQAKTHLSRYLADLKEGDVILLCKRNMPIAEVRLLPATPAVRSIGLAKNHFQVPPSFFEPLPDDVLVSFQGG